MKAFLCVSALLFGSWGAATGAGAAQQYGFGKPATAAEIAGWDIDVRPDGRGLPRGGGSVEQGQAIYDVKCASCHGTFGESNAYLQIAGGVGTLASAQPLRTTGSKLKYATTLWDYIRRAMPFGAPQTLGVDEVYALTAYVLNLNEIVPRGTALDQDTLPRLKMPNRDQFTTVHGMLRKNGTPDTANVACMSNCAPVAKISSKLPAYARDSHGNLMEQRRPLGGIAGVPSAFAVATTATPRGEVETARRVGCMACHNVETAIVGPAFRDVAARYRSDPRDAVRARLIDKIRHGGAGAWGPAPMPAQPGVAADDARALVDWILAGAE